MLSQNWETIIGGSNIIQYYGINPPRDPHIGDVWVSPKGAHIFEENKWVLIEKKENNVDNVMEKRCEYCGTKILEVDQTHCKSCGAPL